MTIDLFGGPAGKSVSATSRRMPRACGASLCGHDTLAALEVDYTPPAVAVQCLIALRTEIDAAGVVWSPRRALDPAAGSGCWGRAMRAVLGPDVELVGVEPRTSEEANFDTYDAAFALELARFIECVRGRCKPFDFVATNPPFSGFAPEGFWPLALLEAGLLHAGSIVALLGLSQWGQSAEAVPMLRCWSPVLQLRLGGRPAFRPDGQTDAREYSLWVWSCADGWSRPMGARPSWRTVQLPTLPTGLRRWSPSAVPGTYPIAPALVAEIQERYL